MLSTSLPRFELAFSQLLLRRAGLLLGLLLQLLQLGVRGRSGLRLGDVSASGSAFASQLHGRHALVDQTRATERRRKLASKKHE